MTRPSADRAVRLATHALHGVVARPRSRRRSPRGCLSQGSLRRPPYSSTTRAKWRSAPGNAFSRSRLVVSMNQGLRRWRRISTCSYPSPAVSAAKQNPGMHYANDVLRLVAIEGQPRMSAFQGLWRLVGQRGRYVIMATTCGAPSRPKHPSPPGSSTPPSMPPVAALHGLPNGEIVPRLLRIPRRASTSTPMSRRTRKIRSVIRTTHWMPKITGPRTRTTISVGARNRAIYRWCA